MNHIKNLFLLLIFLACADLESAVLRVGPGFAYANVQPACAAARSGDSILMRGGTYAGGQYIANLKGTAAQWIYIGASAGETVVVSGGSEAWHLVDAEYVKIFGIVFKMQTANGVNADDGGSYETPSHHLIFEHCTWDSMAATGNNDQVKLSGVDSFEVRNCLFRNGSAGGSGVDMVGCHWGVFTDNRFENQGSNSIQAKGGSRFIRMERNLFKDGGERAINLGGSTGLQFFRPDTARFEAADLQVYANIFIGSYAPVAYVGCINVAVVNNTFYQPEHWVIRILQETVDSSRFVPCSNNSFRNNIVYLGSSVATECNVGASTQPQTFRFSNNLWYNYQSAAWRPRNVPVTDSNSIVGSDPLFTDPSSEDFSISASSPAALKGLSLADPVLDYAKKPFLPSRSIGGLEAGPSARIIPGRQQVKGNRVVSDTRALTYTINGRRVKETHGRAPLPGVYVRGSGNNVNIEVK